MSNLDLWNKVKTPPQEALKQIKGGRLSGFTDISPMWRIQAMTEQFGMCGDRWKYEITKQWTELGANDEVMCFCNINLYVKLEDGWSEPIPGTGGSKLVTKEKSGLHTSDEGYKMALTDALSVAMKALGFGADIYWGDSKYKTSLIESDRNNVADKIREKGKKEESKEEKKKRHILEIAEGAKKIAKIQNRDNTSMFQELTFYEYKDGSVSKCDKPSDLNNYSDTIVNIIVDRVRKYLKELNKR